MPDPARPPRPSVHRRLAGAETCPHTIRRYNDADDNLVIEFITMHGAGHAWVGGDPDGSFVDPARPDLARIAYRFLSRHSLQAAPTSRGAAAT